MRCLRFPKFVLWLLPFSALALLVTGGTRAGGRAPKPALTPAPAYEGFHDWVDCNYIAGWVWDRNNPGVHYEITVYDGTVPIAAGIANQLRGDLANAGKGDGSYGFAVPTPARIKDGQNHSITVKVTNTNFSLGGTPKIFNSATSACPATTPTVAPAYEGFHESVDCNYVAGWAWDRNRPGSHLTVSVLDETGAVLATGTVNQLRADLASAGKGDGSYGFGIPTPDRIKDGQTHSITVKVTDTVFNLGGTPKSFNSSTAGCLTPKPSPNPAGQITMTVLTRTPESKHSNFRVQAANQSVSYTPASGTDPAKYHVYGDGAFDTWRWNSDNNGFESFYNTVYPIGSAIDDCAYGTDPRLWKSRCTSDAIGYFWKQIACPPGSTGVACEGNDRWNASPGTYNITTFTSPSLWPNLHTDDYGTTGYATVINAAKINSVAIQPSAGNCQSYGDTVWADDILPAGAVQQGNESWKWAYASPAPSYFPSDDPNAAPKPLPTPVSTADPTFPPPPFPSWVSHQSSRAGGTHQHLFTDAYYPLKVNAGDSLFAYIYIDPNSPPREVMLQWYEPATGWEHRAYWGANKIAWGTNATASRWWMGNVPASGQWVRLEIPATKVGLEGRTITGIAFTLFDGQATWDRTGKSAPVSSHICPPKMAASPDQSFHAYNPDEFATGADYPAVQQVKFADGSTRWFMAFNRMVKYVTTTYSAANPNYPGPGQLPTTPYNDSTYGESWADNWQVMWATSPDGANWTVQPQMLLRSVSEKQRPWLGMLVQDMIIDGGYFYLLVQDMSHPHLYLLRAPIDTVNSSISTGYLQNASQGWRIASYPLQATGEYTWKSFSLGAQLDFEQLGAFPVMQTRYDPSKGFVKRSAIGRVFSTTSGDSLYFGVTNDWDGLQLWKTISLTKPFQYESNVVIEDTTFKPSGFSFRYGFTHYADNMPGSPQILCSGFDWWMAEDLTDRTLFGHSTSPASSDGYSTAGRHTARLSGF